MKRTIALLSLLCALPVSAHAQSLFGTQGLGAPLAGLDARARGLGVNGVGLIGLSTSLVNPADQAGIFRRGVSASFQPWSGTASVNGESGDIGGTRFPVLQIFYPAGRFTLTAGYSGMLDQSWAIIAEGEEVLGDETVPIVDVIRSNGGLSEIKVGAGYYMNERISLGLSVGMHTGNVQRSITRQYPDSSLLLPFSTTQSWKYSGPTATIGARWDPIRQVRVGASISWSGTLEAEPDSLSSGTHEYDMPVRLNAGASAQLTPRLLLTASGSVANWSGGSYTAPGTTEATVADRTVDVGAGLEWSELRSGERVFPLRLGVRRTQLPFHTEGETAANELTLSGGLGLQLAADDFGPLAVADIGVERGTREGWESTANPDGLSEKFWRFTVSISLFGR
jgi:opacity protein-like surface antigen